MPGEGPQLFPQQDQGTDHFVLGSVLVSLEIPQEQPTTSCEALGGEMLGKAPPGWPWG